MVVVPPSQTSQSPVVVQTSNTINTIVAQSAAAKPQGTGLPVTTPVGTQSSATSGSDTKSDTKSEGSKSPDAKKSESVDSKTGDSKNVPAPPKTYCN